MSWVKRVMVSTVAVAVAVAPMSAAMADRGWGGGKHYGRHHRGDDTFGKFLLGSLILGGIAVVAASAAKSKKQEQSQSSDDGRWDDNSRERSDDGWRNNRGRDSGSADAATEICVTAAEREASRNGGRAHVEAIDYVGRSGENWRVEGAISADRFRGDHSFICEVAYGQLEMLRFGDKVAAR